MVEDRSVQKCRKLQSGLLINLLKVVSPDSSTAMFTVEESAASSVNINRVQLEEMCLVIRKSLKQAAEQKFSIAFCGMVKAGYADLLRTPSIHWTIYNQEVTFPQCGDRTNGTSIEW
jgi:hypothetical protein